MKSYLVNCVLLVLTAVISCSDAEHIQAALRRGSVKVKGVNLGGWLLAEHWMTYDSGIWQDVPIAIAQKGEYATMQYLGHAKGDARFEQHRATWITEADIAEIAREGLNTVRVSIGYWIMGSSMPSDASSSPNEGQWQVYAPGGLKYLDLLINSWAVRHNVAVLLSLHGHRGSQNGKDYSAPPDLGIKQWSQYPSNVDNSVQWVQFLADRYRPSPAFLGMSIMNEPEYSTSREVVFDFYRRVHHLLRSRGDDSVIVTAPMLSEQTPAFMADFLKGEKNVWHEWHPYYKWGHEGKNEEQLIVAASGYSNLVTAWRGNPLLISEWSMGVWDQYAPFTDRVQFQRFGRTQLASYAPAQAGWTFWSWRHSDDTNGKRSGWSMRGLLRAGLLVV